MSTLFVNNLNTVSGTDITVASGKTIKAPGMIVPEIGRASSRERV